MLLNTGEGIDMKKHKLFPIRAFDRILNKILGSQKTPKYAQVIYQTLIVSAVASSILILTLAVAFALFLRLAP
jgi:hypothetical protein